MQAGDEAVVVQVATREPRTALLRDPAAIFLVAFDDGAPVGLVLGYELQRRHGYNVTLCIYEIDVNAAYRRCCSAGSWPATACSRPLQHRVGHG